MTKRVFKKIRKYYSSNLKRNLKNTIILTGILPIIMISFLAYFTICSYQWNSILNEVKTTVYRAADAINIELTNALQSSSTIVFNTYISSGISQNYDEDTERKVNFYQIIDLYITNYNYPLDVNEQQIVIFHNNNSLFRSKYTHELSELNTDIKNKVFDLNYGEVYWEISENKSISLYRKFENTGKFQSILKFTIPYNKIKYITENLNIQNAKDVDGNQIHYGIDNSGNGDSDYYQVGNNLINGSQFRALIPLSLKKAIYFNNFIVIFSVLTIFTFLLFLIAILLSKTMTRKIYGFIENIKNKKSLSELKNIEIDDLDEFAMIYQTIKDLIAKIDDIHSELDKAKSDKIALELEFAQSKINPHLLYNSLSSMKWKAMDAGNLDFAKNIDTLTFYYRDSLSNGKNIVKIRQEIDLVKKYIKVMEFSHSHIYPYEIDVDEDVLNTFTIKHILQPIVENSILHGINRKKDGFIKITGHKDGNKIILKVIDNGLGMNPQKLKEINSFNYDSQYKNYGIKNTMRRIKLYYGNDCYMHIESTPGCGTTITIVLENINPDKFIEQFEFLG